MDTDETDLVQTDKDADENADNDFDKNSDCDDVNDENCNNEQVEEEVDDLLKLEEKELVAVKEDLGKIYDIWNTLGVDPGQKKGRAKCIWVLIKNLLNDVYGEEIARFIGIQENIQKYNAQIKELSALLLVPLQEVSCKTLIDQEHTLRFYSDKLACMKLEREIAYKELKRKEKKLCRFLKKPEHQLPSIVGVPTEKELEVLKKHVKLLKEEAKTRHKEFRSAKKELISIWETTSLSPKTIKELEVHAGIGNVSVSDNTMDDLEEVIREAKKKKSELEPLREDLVKRLGTLWQRLRVDQRIRDEFLANHVDLRLPTINSILEEIERCEKLKFDNCDVYMDSLRQELHDLWDKCCVSETVRQQFAYYSGGKATNEAVADQEAEDKATNEAEAATESMRTNEAESVADQEAKDKATNVAEAATESMRTNEAESVADQEAQDKVTNEAEATTESMETNEAEDEAVVANKTKAIAANKAKAVATKESAAIIATKAEVMVAYEAELEKWNSYYEDAQHIIKKIMKRKSLWQELIDFEIKAADPNRYKDRSWNSLREEKSRKKLQKIITDTENSIFKDIKAYEVEKGVPFLLYSEDFGSFVANYRVQRTNEMKTLKQKTIHKKQLALITLKSSPRKTVNSKAKTSKTA